MEVRAIRFHGVDDLRLERVDLRAPGPDDVVARVDACGVCGSDLHFLDGTARTGRVPVTLGHEIAATVIESNDPDWSEGDQVLVAPGTHCGTCSRCREGRTNLCEHARVAGVSVDGGWADAIVFPGSALIRRPPELPVGAAAVAMDAGVTAFHAVIRRGRVGEGHAVAVFGAGGLGIFGLQIAKAAGAAPVVVVDTDPAALDRALAFGADEVVHSGPRVSAGREIKLLTDGGVDVAVEFVGVPAAIDTALKSLRPGGTAVAVGVGSEPLATLPPVLWATHEYELRGSFGGLPGDAERLLAMMAKGTVRPPLLTEISLDEAAPVIMERARGDVAAAGRLVVVP